MLHWAQYWDFIFSHFDTTKNAANELKDISRGEHECCSCSLYFDICFNIHSMVIASCSVCMNLWMNKIYKRRSVSHVFQIIIIPVTTSEYGKKSNKFIYRHVSVKFLFIDLMADPNFISVKSILGQRK